MNPLEQYGKIQAFVQKEARDVATEVYKELGTLFGVSEVPYHIHNGVDSELIPFANLADSDFYRVVRYFTLSSSQILSLNTTPITIIPSYGTRSIIIVEGITAFINYKGTQYTGSNALEFRYTNASGAKVTADIPSSFIDSSANAYYHAPAVSSGFIPVEAAPVVVRVPTADPGAGNSPITFCIAYRIVPFNK